MDDKKEDGAGPSLLPLDTETTLNTNVMLVTSVQPLAPSEDVHTIVSTVAATNKNDITKAMAKHEELSLYDGDFAIEEPATFASDAPRTHNTINNENRFKDETNLLSLAPGVYVQDELAAAAEAVPEEQEDCQRQQAHYTTPTIVPGAVYVNLSLPSNLALRDEEVPQISTGSTNDNREDTPMTIRAARVQEPPLVIIGKPENMLITRPHWNRTEKVWVLIIFFVVVSLLIGVTLSVSLLKTSDVPDLSSSITVDTFATPSTSTSPSITPSIVSSVNIAGTFGRPSSQLFGVGPSVVFIADDDMDGDITDDDTDPA